MLPDTPFLKTLETLAVNSTLRAMRLAGQLEGMLTDPVYEGKSMDGLIQMVQSGEIPKGAKVLYAHLGGAPALSAYASLFKESQPVKL